MFFLKKTFHYQPDLRQPNGWDWVNILRFLFFSCNFAGTNED